MTPIDFQTEPSRYRHWRIEPDGDIAFLVMDVAADGGLSPDYELKLNSYDLAVDHIMLVDDRRSTVALPETPLLAVLPGTGGLTRVTDKRKVRRDLADVFCSTEEGVRGQKAVDWRLVDEVVAKSKWEDAVKARAKTLAARSDRPADAQGVKLGPLDKRIEANAAIYSLVRLDIERDRALATVTVKGPAGGAPDSLDAAKALGARFWPLALARELEDAILHLRFNEPAIGLVVLRAEGDAQAVLDHDAFLARHADDWLMREIRHYLKRVLKRVDVTAKSLI